MPVLDGCSDNSVEPAAAGAVEVGFSFSSSSSSFSSLSVRGVVLALGLDVLNSRSNCRR